MRPLFCLSLGAILVAGCGGCNRSTVAPGDAAPPPVDAQGIPFVDGAGCAPRALPPQVPQGWGEYTDWSCDCRFYIPLSSQALPAPIVWEPCGAGVPTGLDCRWMHVDWTTTDTTPLGLTPRGYVDDSGRVLLRFTRFDSLSSNPTQLFLVAEADGSARTAILSTTLPNTGCALWDFSAMNEGMVVWTVIGDTVAGDWSKSKHHGAIGGSVDTLHPSVLFHYVDTSDYAFTCGGQWIGQLDANSKMTLFPWNAPTNGIPIASAATDPEGIPPVNLSIHGGAAFWDTDSLSRIGIMAWDPTRGAHPLLRWIGDSTQGAWDLGTDRKDMIWEYGQGRSPSASTLDPFPTRAVMTAPFTSDPSALQPRRLRSDPNDSYEHPYVVGCGYGARVTGTNDLFVVRIKDGWGWLLKATPAPSKWSWGQALAITCDEVFVTVQSSSVFQIARVKLTSLGPGLPPD